MDTGISCQSVWVPERVGPGVLPLLLVWLAASAHPWRQQAMEQTHESRRSLSPVASLGALWTVVGIWVVHLRMEDMSLSLLFK